MIRFDCDWCRRTKAADEIWILGLAAEAVGVTAARREITILPAWNRDTAVHPLAVHFCCEECKVDYMAQLFNDRPALASDVVLETTTTRRAPAKSRRVSSSQAKHRARRKKRAA
ncbi:MAG TPA: hypothetical protein VMT53_26430 [Terriglobales bacterium]|nr:hypothetical protein [Terriglobales bacterium]